MLPDDEVTYIDAYCDKAEEKGRERCLDEGASLLRSLMDDSQVDQKRLFYYLVLCLNADGFVTQWEFDLISPLAARNDLHFDTPRDMTNWIRTQNMALMREKETKHMKSIVDASSKKTRDRYLQVGLLLGACDGRVSEYERLFLLDIFGYDYK